jgi:hypothetical protein
VFGGEFRLGIRHGDVRIVAGPEQTNPPIHMQISHDADSSVLCDIKQQYLRSADGSNTQAQQETLVKPTGPQKAVALQATDQILLINRGGGAARRASAVAYLWVSAKPPATNLLSRALGSQALPSFA